MLKNPAYRGVVALVLSMAAPLAAGQEHHAPAPSSAAADTAPAASSSRQDPAGVPVFRAQSDLVVLHVNVFDRRSEAVPELPQSAFEVYEDGVQQRIEFFNDRTVPVATGLVIDNSSSMMTRRSMVAAGAYAFSTTSRDGDEMFTLIFNENVRFGLPSGMPFTQNRHLLQASFERYPPGGMTALHDAVVEGLAHLENATNQKRVLVVLSDGDDNASHQSEANMLHRAARSNALIYTIWTGDVSSRRGDPGLLRKLATRNGGIAYTPKSERDVVSAFGTIAENIRRVYSIGYMPTNGARDGSYRRVKVLVRSPGGSLRVRARDGYTAPEETDVR